MRDEAQSTLDTMRLPNGLYVASLSKDYNYVWIRDTCYAVMAELDADNRRYEQTYHALLDILHQYRWKLEYHAEHRPSEAFEYIHPRYSADDFKEVPSAWGNAQNDAIGILLYGIGRGLCHGRGMLRTDRDREIIQLLVRYLTNLRYWEDADNGMWEENREVHASSVAACVAGLMAVAPYVDVGGHTDAALDAGVNSDVDAHVAWNCISGGMASLYRLLPNESASKSVDLAMLSVVYPYRLVPPEYARFLVERVEHVLLRKKGVIRYVGDKYYREGSSAGESGEANREAEWTFGLPWLGLCHASLGNREKAMAYLRRTEAVMVEPGVLPELYLAKSGRPNGNTPLAWAVSMYLQLWDALK